MGKYEEMLKQSDSLKLVLKLKEEFYSIDHKTAHQISRKRKIPVKVLKELRDKDDFDRFLYWACRSIVSFTECASVVRNNPVAAYLSYKTDLEFERLVEIINFLEKPGSEGSAPPTYVEFSLIADELKLDKTTTDEILKMLYEREFFEPEIRGNNESKESTGEEANIDDNKQAPEGELAGQKISSKEETKS